MLSLPRRIATGTRLIGTVIDNGTPRAPFYCVAFAAIDAPLAQRLVRGGKAYARRNPALAAWRVDAPRAWSKYRIGPHVTLDQRVGRSLLGRRVAVQLLARKTVDTGRSRWIMYDVDLRLQDGDRGAVTACGLFPCHLSIAQQRLAPVKTLTTTDAIRQTEGTTVLSRRRRRSRSTTKARRAARRTDACSPWSTTMPATHAHRTRRARRASCRHPRSR